MSGKQPEQWYVGRHEQLWGMDPKKRNAIQDTFFHLAEIIRGGQEAYEPTKLTELDDNGRQRQVSAGTHTVKLTDHFKSCACVDLGRDGKGRPLGDAKLSPPREDVDLGLPHDPWIGMAKYLTEYGKAAKAGGVLRFGISPKHVHIYRFDDEAGLFSCTYEGCGKQHLPEEEL